MYLEGRPTSVLDTTKVLELFGGKGAYRRFVLDGIGQGHKEQYYEVEDQRFLGAGGFGDKVQKRLGKGQREVIKRPVGAVLKDLAQHLGVAVESLRSPDRSWAISKARTTIAYVLTRRLGYGTGEVAAYLRRDMATVGTLVGRLFDRMRSDEQLQRDVERLTKIVET
jgi:hypothetical protein